jgi:hypothetical protein
MLLILREPRTLDGSASTATTVASAGSAVSKKRLVLLKLHIAPANATIPTKPKSLLVFLSFFESLIFVATP